MLEATCQATSTYITRCRQEEAPPSDVSAKQKRGGVHEFEKFQGDIYEFYLPPELSLRQRQFYVSLIKQQTQLLTVSVTTAYSDRMASSAEREDAIL